MLFQVMWVRIKGASPFAHPGSGLGSGRLPRPPRLGALPAVPRHPVRELALRRAVPRAGAAGGAVAAPLQVLLPAPRRHSGQAGGRHAARAAAPQAQHRQRLRKVVVVVDGGVVDATARDVEHRGPRVVPEGRLGGSLGAVGASLEKQLDEAGVVPDRGVQQRREAGGGVAGRRGEVNVCAADQECDGHFGEADAAGGAERGPALGVDGVGGCDVRRKKGYMGQLISLTDQVVSPR
jgi:hypothetical protein